MFWGVVVGIIATALLGCIPLFGPLLAGFIAGLIVSGVGRGTLAGFLSGSFGILNVENLSQKEILI